MSGKRFVRVDSAGPHDDDEPRSSLWSQTSAELNLSK
jgi:hypothetical protein